MLEWRQGKDKSITPLERHPVRYYFREQGDMEKQWCGGYSLFGGEIETLTISIACFTRLELHTNLQLVIERSVVNGGVSEAASEDNQEIFLTLSTVSLQYIGTVGTVPALILPLSDITRTGNGKWSMRDDGSFANSLSGKKINACTFL